MARRAVGFLRVSLLRGAPLTSRHAPRDRRRGRDRWQLLGNGRRADRAVCSLGRAYDPLGHARAKASAVYRGHARPGPVRSSYPRRAYPAEHHADRVGEPLCQHRIRARVPVRPVLPGPRRRGTGRRLGAPACGRTSSPRSKPRRVSSCRPRHHCDGHSDQHCG